MKPIEPTARPSCRATSRYGSSELAEERQRDHLAAARRKLRDGLSHDLFPLQLFDEIRRPIRFEPRFLGGRQLVFRSPPRLPFPIETPGAP